MDTCFSRILVASAVSLAVAFVLTNRPLELDADTIEDHYCSHTTLP